MFGVLRPGSPERERLPISPTASPPPLRSLAPMPPSQFNSREELLEGCKDWAASQGYAVVIARSRFNRLWLKCDRGGTYENRRNLTPDQRKRKRGDSRLLGCPFKMLATCKKDGIWRVGTEVPNHNHDPSDDLSAHPTLRRMTDQQLQKVHDMCDEGKSPAETLEELRTMWPDIKVLTRDIYNARKKHKTQREEAELAAGRQHELPYQDPNELGLPGPNPNGKWAWVPDGEEVTNKKSKRKRKSAPLPAAQSTLDPQLQASNVTRLPQQPPTAGSQPRFGFDDVHDPAQQLRGAAKHQYGQYVSTPKAMPPSPSTARTVNSSDYYQNANDGSAALSPYTPHSSSNGQFNSPPSRFGSQQSAAPTATMSSVPVSTDSNVPATQLGETRIERVEKELRDQKNMLAQILGAVQGFGGSPDSESRA